VPVNHLFAGVPVADYGAALSWYERLFGRAPDLLPNEIEAAWQLTDRGWVYIVVDSERAGNGLVTILVDDLDERVAEIARQGLAGGEIETLPGLVRRTYVEDPDGNTIQLGQPLDA
jgi:predicted enzyme related to lactoylglutathione lyase